MPSDVASQPSPANGKHLHLLNMGTPGAGVVVDVNGRIVELNGDEIGSNRVISHAGITAKVSVPFGFHHAT